MTDRFKRVMANPPLVVALSFGIIILIAGILLNLPFFTNDNSSVGFLNSLFTAASALCVTGLTTVNTAETWNFFGQLVIIILIQIGGLGIMTMATFVPMVLSKKIGMVSRQIIKEELNFESYSGVIALLKYVIKISFLVELIGMIVMAFEFIPAFGLGRGLWYSVFHSISAYCNAGFDLLGDSMVDYKSSLIINIPIMTLIIIGGIGFQVILEIFDKKRFKKFSAHSKLVLSMTGILIVVGAVLFFVLEDQNTLINESRPGQIIQSLFQSVVTRTAGFYSIDNATFTDGTAVLFIILMFIGGSPGSTAGGLKTTTFGILFYATIATIKGEDIVIFKKEIPQEVILKSLSLVTLSMLMVMGLSFVMTVIEPFSFLDILFEITSAFGTVGLSRGITPVLSNISKLIVIFTMYIGRIGPLTFGYAVGRHKNKSKLKYPKANITVG